MYLPTLDPYPGYTPIRVDPLDDGEYEELGGSEEICPERRTNIISSKSFYWFNLKFSFTNYNNLNLFYNIFSCFFLGIFFSWMNPLMLLGYKRPLTEKDIWKLDTWDQTETLNSKYVVVSSF